MPPPNTLLRTSWWVATLLAAFSLWQSIPHVLRMEGAGDPKVPIDLANANATATQQFRVWSRSNWTLHLATVNHQPPFGARYAGAFEVRLIRPTGADLVRRVFDGGRIEHQRPNNFTSTELARVELPSRLFRRWEIHVRVMRADPQFRGAASQVWLSKDRSTPDLGLGGVVFLLLYAAGFFFLLLSLTLAAIIARHGPKKYMIVSAAFALIMAGVWSLQ